MKNEKERSLEVYDIPDELDSSHGMITLNSDDYKGEWEEYQRKRDIEFKELEHKKDSMSFNDYMKAWNEIYN